MGDSGEERKKGKRSRKKERASCRGGMSVCLANCWHRFESPLLTFLAGPRHPADFHWSQIRREISHRRHSWQVAQNTSHWPWDVSQGLPWETFQDNHDVGSQLMRAPEIVADDLISWLPTSRCSSILVLVSDNSDSSWPKPWRSHHLTSFIWLINYSFEEEATASQAVVDSERAKKKTSRELEAAQMKSFKADNLAEKARKDKEEKERELN